MNSTLRLPPTLGTLARMMLGATLAAVAAFGTAAQAAVGATYQVGYSPTMRQIQGAIPYGETYSLTITAPGNLNGATTVSIVAAVNAKPDAASPATALGYVTFSSSTLTFTAPNQQQTVTVSFAVPSDAVAGTYGYKIKAEGWPSSLGANNNGTEINASISISADPLPPVVDIVAPVQGSVREIIPPATLPIDVPFSFTATAPTGNNNVITAVDADIGGASITLAATGLNTTQVTGTGTLRISSPGTYVVTARATNLAGTASDSNSFTVRVEGPPPTVTIDAPTLNQPFDLPYGTVTVDVPFQFTGGAPSGTTIRTMEARLFLNNGTVGTPVSFSTSGLYTTTAIGSATLPVGTIGTHRLEVRVTNEYGEASTSQTFLVNRRKAVLTVTADNKSKVYGAANPALTVTYSGFLGSDTLATAGIVGAPAVSTTATTGSAVGSYPIVATLGTLASPNYTFVFAPGALAVTKANLVLTASNATRTVGEPNPVFQYSTIGLTNGDSLATAVSGGTPTLGTTATTASPAGTYPITFTNQASLQSANYTLTFVPGTLSVQTISTPATFTVSGTVFFDVNANGTRNTGDPAMSGIQLKLYRSTGQYLAATTTTANGSYSFTVAPGSYSIDVVEPAGMTPSTVTPRSVTVGSVALADVNFGLSLDFCALKNLNAEGKSQGYWKNNLTKANSKSSGGMQETKADILAYTSTISSLMLAPFNGLTLTQAISVMNSKDQLQLQLLAAEYNYVSGRLIANHAALTAAFIHWGEQVAANPSAYSSSYRNFVKDWMDAYNNSYGGKIDGPLP